MYCASSNNNHTVGKIKASRSLHYQLAHLSDSENYLRVKKERDKMAGLKFDLVP